MTIKAISLWEPWASAMALKLKTIETRHWDTQHRGLLAIHAAKKPLDPYAKALYDSHKDLPAVLAFGMVTCVVRLVDCVGTGDGRVTAAMRKLGRRFDASERAWGNYDDGRYAWITEHVLSFQPGIMVGGHQGLWNWELSPLVEEHLREMKVL